jgi:hypothetical protein
MRYGDYLTPVRGLYCARWGMQAGVAGGISGWQAPKAALAGRCSQRLAGARRMPGPA